MASLAFALGGYRCHSALEADIVLSVLSLGLHAAMTAFIIVLEVPGPTSVRPVSILSCRPTGYYCFRTKGGSVPQSERCLQFYRA